MAGKGSKQRPVKDIRKFRDEYERIFRKGNSRNRFPRQTIRLLSSGDRTKLNLLMTTKHSPEFGDATNLKKSLHLSDSLDHIAKTIQAVKICNLIRNAELHHNQPWADSLRKDLKALGA
jgi:hypothetical protein